MNEIKNLLGVGDATRKYGNNILDLVEFGIECIDLMMRIINRSEIETKFFAARGTTLFVITHIIKSVLLNSFR